jgi:hypothetical protein
MFGPILLAVGIGVGWLAYKAANRSTTSRRLVSGYLADRLTENETITLGLTQKGFTDIGPIMTNGDEWRAYAKPPSPLPTLPMALNYMGFPAFAVTDIEPL